MKKRLLILPSRRHFRNLLSFVKTFIFPFLFTSSKTQKC
jgi:hypothetical protein